MTDSGLWAGFHVWHAPCIQIRVEVAPASRAGAPAPQRGR